MPQDSVIIRDTSLREGLDVPGLDFSLAEKLKVVHCLKNLGIKEIEIGQPNQIAKSRSLHEKIKQLDSSFITSGLIFGFGDFKKELKEARFLDRIDILMPLLSRGPAQDKKIDILTDALKEAKGLYYKNISVGFPHATSADLSFLSDISYAAFKNGAERIIVYDTNGKATPEDIYKIVIKLLGILPIHIHCHNDRGLALINSLAAIDSGAKFVDATFGGVGDRAGNTALEALIINLELEGSKHNMNLKCLKRASDIVAKITKLRSPLFPVTGDFSFYHSTKTHLEKPELFEAFSPDLIGAKRKVESILKINTNGKVDALCNIIKQRRSVRDFKPTKVKKSILRSIIKSGSFAPSSMDGQPWHFVIVDNKELIKKIAQIKNNRCPAEKLPYTADFLLKAPLLIVVCVDKGKSFDREIENAVLAASHIMLMASAYGLGTTYLSAYRQNDPLLEQDIKELLHLPQDVMPVTIIPLGVPCAECDEKRIIDINPRIHRNFYAHG